ncbi:hypothetical protein Ahy_A02g007135 isoform B [Arachis hypogaea]|uniref:Uncharacterized protein n=1 Tax=Arachis hypogaea TaxID=3818 RepID=A0A445EBW2_ARAHY|nr:hypothetical protein Ahy_A02g007135 isoform B [Arachis hypogaea]
MVVLGVSVSHFNRIWDIDSNLICRITMPVIQSNPSVIIPVLQSTVRQSYHFKSSYRKVWMVNQKTIAQIYDD